MFCSKLRLSLPQNSDFEVSNFEPGIFLNVFKRVSLRCEYAGPLERKCCVSSNACQHSGQQDVCDKKWSYRCLFKSLAFFVIDKG